jgi:hypothetical protein
MTTFAPSCSTELADLALDGVGVSSPQPRPTSSIGVPLNSAPPQPSRALVLEVTVGAGEVDHRQGDAGDGVLVEAAERAPRTPEERPA